MKEMNSGHTGDLVKHIGLFLCKVAYSSYDGPSFESETRAYLIQHSATSVVHTASQNNRLDN